EARRVSAGELLGAESDVHHHSPGGNHDDQLRARPGWQRKRRRFHRLVQSARDREVNEVFFLTTFPRAGVRPLPQLVRRTAMPNLTQRSSGTLLLVLVFLLLPSMASAQAAITGVVKDNSGGVLPGVKGEAASPALIEKVRSVVTDATGQYRIVDLRPGVYSVVFELPGFSLVRREGIELSGNFVATVNADLRVGALEETITVTGETPIVDVQSARTQQIITRDIISAIPSSRNALGLQNLIPGMTATGGVGIIGNSNTDSGGIGGSMQGVAAAIHGGRA